MINIKKKNYPLWLVILLDLLLSAAVLLGFAFFHHVRPAMFQDFDPLDKFEQSQKPTEEAHLIHNWVLKEVIAPQCTAEGYTVYSCTCGEEKIDERTEATGHGTVIIRGALEASYDQDGYTGDEHCSVCDALLKKGIILPALEHENTEVQNFKKATCTEEGYSGDIFCLDCNKIVATGSITPVTEHTYAVKEVIPANCQAQGFTLYACADCPAEKMGDYTPIGAHTRGSGGKCTVCAEYLVDISGQFGISSAGMFLDDDSVVTLTDDAEIRKYAAEQFIELPTELPIYGQSDRYISLYRSHDVYVAVREITGKRKFYYIYDIHVRNIENFYSVAGKTSKFETHINKAEETMGAAPVLAINGDYYSLRHCNIAVRNGELLKSNETVTRDVAVLGYDGSVTIYTPQEYNLDTVISSSPFQVWNFGPSLLDKNGKAIPEEDYDYNAYKEYVITDSNPRTAFGYYQPGHYCFLSVEGRTSRASGLDLEDLAQVFEDIGCSIGYNFDGGGSSQSYLMGEYIQFSNESGDDMRKIPDILCIGEVKRKDED